MKAAITVVEATILLIVGIIGFFFGLLLISTIITGTVQGKCWMDMGQTMSKVKSDLDSASGLPKTGYKIVMGDCVGGVVAFNKDMPSEVQQLSQIVNDYCPKSSLYNSYILILPWKTLKAEAEKDKSWWTAIWEKFSWKYYSDAAYKIYQTARLFKPNCIGLDARFSQTYFIPPELAKGPKNLNEKQIALCYSLSRTSTSPTPGYKYDYSYVMEYQNTLSKPEEECTIK